MIGPQVLLRHRMRIARENARLTQEACGELVGVSHGVVWEWECGRRRPAEYALRKFGSVCGVDTEWLLQGGGSIRRVCCPVCRRDVAISGINRIVSYHNDTAHNPCDMSGRAVPVEPAEVA